MWLANNNITVLLNERDGKRSTKRMQTCTTISCIIYIKLYCSCKVVKHICYEVLLSLTANGYPKTY